MLTTILKGHTDYVNGIAFTTTNNQLVSCSDDKSIFFWDITSSTKNG